MSGRNTVCELNAGPMMCVHHQDDRAWMVCTDGMPAAVGTANLDHPRQCTAISNALALVSVHTDRRNVGLSRDHAILCMGTQVMMQFCVWAP